MQRCPGGNQQPYCRDQEMCNGIQQCREPDFDVLSNKRLEEDRYAASPYKIESIAPRASLNIVPLKVMWGLRNNLMKIQNKMPH